MESLQFVGCSWFIGLIGLGFRFTRNKSTETELCALPCPFPVSSSTHLDAPGVHSLAGSKIVDLLRECSLVSQVNRSLVSCSWVSTIESNHAIHFCSKSMHARIQCLSLILTGMIILEHVKMSTYLVSLAPRISPSSTQFQKNGVAKFQSFFTMTVDFVLELV